MNVSLKSAPFKRDRLTILSIILLVIVIGTELTLMFWLPYQARSVYLWEKQVAQQEMLQTLDKLRSGLDDLKPVSHRQEGEIMLVRDCLDGIARYLRANATKMGIGQINDVYRVLLDLEQCYLFFKHGGEYSLEDELNINKSLQQIFPGIMPVTASGK